MQTWLSWSICTVLNLENDRPSSTPAIYRTMLYQWSHYRSPRPFFRSSACLSVRPSVPLLNSTTRRPFYPLCIHPAVRPSVPLFNSMTRRPFDPLCIVPSVTLSLDNNRTVVSAVKDPSKKTPRQRSDRCLRNPRFARPPDGLSRTFGSTEMIWRGEKSRVACPCLLNDGRR